MRLSKLERKSVDNVLQKIKNFFEENVDQSTKKGEIARLCLYPIETINEFSLKHFRKQRELLLKTNGVVYDEETTQFILFAYFMGHVNKYKNLIIRKKSKDTNNVTDLLPKGNDVF